MIVEVAQELVKAQQEYIESLRTQINNLNGLVSTLQELRKLETERYEHQIESLKTAFYTCFPN